jgi:DNA-directed RNA polymerase specialized sigma24 family protein
VAITANKAIDLIRHQSRQKRGGPLDERAPEAAQEELQQVIGREPTPEFALLLAEEWQRLLDLLNDDGLRSIALWRMEGDSVEQIAARLGCVPRTVERKLRMIRRLWGEEIAP